MIKLGVQSNVVDRKLLIYYETFDIIKYVHMAYTNDKLVVYAFLKLNLWKIIAIILMLI
jgi:hypothetical protein